MPVYKWVEVCRDAGKSRDENNDEWKEAATVVPVVDMEKEGSLARSVGRAFQQTGMFYVVNHGVPEELLCRLQQQAEMAFALPLETKKQASKRPDDPQLGGYGGAPLLPHFSDRIICSEGFTFTASASSHYVASNLWDCPNQQSSFREAIQEYKAAMLSVATRLMKAALEGLTADDDQEEEDEECEEKKEKEKEKEEDTFSASSYYAGLQLNHYPASPVPEQTLGMPEHTDSGFLTLLHQWPSHVHTLQIKSRPCLLNQSQDWHVVSPLPHALLVNAGDLLQVVSNGRYESVLHKVASSTEPRHSVAYIWGPPLDKTIGCRCLWPCRRSSAAASSAYVMPLYKPLTWKQYLSTRATHFHGALDMYLLHHDHVDDDAAAAAAGV